jgi:TrmH family RNA methyltransferase
VTAHIASLAHPLVRRGRLLGRSAEDRHAAGAFLVEGVRAVQEAVRAKAAIERVFLSPRIEQSDRGKALAALLRGSPYPLHEVSHRVLEAIAPSETPQGVVAIVRTPEATGLLDTREAAFWAAGCGLQDPGNVGTLLRCADAAGASACVFTAGSADPLSPKAVRASAGSLFHLPVVTGLTIDAFLTLAEARDVRLIGCSASGGTPYREIDYRGSIGLVFGREGPGLPPALAGRLRSLATIPMRPGVESLNVGAAAAVILFEAARQRAEGRDQPA